MFFIKNTNYITNNKLKNKPQVSRPRISLLPLNNQVKSQYICMLKIQTVKKYIKFLL